VQLLTPPAFVAARVKALLDVLNTLSAHNPPQIEEELPEQGTEHFDGEVIFPLAPLLVKE